MPTSEKREVERASNVLMVNYRQINKSHEYLLGISNNYSHKGISLEAARIESKPGEQLELILINPYSELSVSAIGEMVWKAHGWYKCITGIKLKDLDPEAVDKIKDLVTNSAMLRNGPPLVNETAEPSKGGAEEVSAVVDGASESISRKAEDILLSNSPLSRSNKAAVFGRDRKGEQNPFQNRTDRTVIKIIILILALVVSALIVYQTLNN